MISQTAEPILENLDRYGMYFTYRLYRESTRSTSGHIVKVRGSCQIRERD